MTATVATMLPTIKAFATSTPTAVAAAVAMVDTNSLTIGLLGVVSSLTVALVSYRQTMNREHIAGTDRLVGHLENRVNSEIQESATYRALAEGRQETILELQKEGLMKDIGIMTLVAQVQRLGAEPDWTPEELQ